MTPVAPRHYDSSRRKAQQRQTRLQIARAAREEFLTHGYSGATIGAIARRADVAQETVYAIFKNKRNILDFALDISVAGDDEPVPIIRRAGPQSILSDTDQRRQLRAFAADITTILGRSAAMFEVSRVAGMTESGIAARVKRLLHERMANMRLVARHLGRNGPLRMSESQAAQEIWILTSPDVFLLITRNLGWSANQYRKWLTDTLARVLFP